MTTDIKETPQILHSRFLWAGESFPKQCREVRSASSSRTWAESTSRAPCLAHTHAAHMQEPGTGAVTQRTAALPCPCIAPQLGCQSSVLCSTNPVLQWLNHVSLQIVLDKSQKTNEGDENSQINTRVQKWNYSSKMVFPVRPLAWNSLHFHGTTTGTNKLIDIWQSYTTTTHSCSVVFFLQYWL